jgi:hypothetical protein
MRGVEDRSEIRIQGMFGYGEGEGCSVQRRSQVRTSERPWGVVEEWDIGARRIASGTPHACQITELR